MACEAPRVVAAIAADGELAGLVDAIKDAVKDRDARRLQLEAERDTVRALVRPSRGGPGARDL